MSDPPPIRKRVLISNDDDIFDDDSEDRLQKEKELFQRIRTNKQNEDNDTDSPLNTISTTTTTNNMSISSTTSTPLRLTPFKPKGPPLKLSLSPPNLNTNKSPPLPPQPFTLKLKLNTTPIAPIKLKLSPISNNTPPQVKPYFTFPLPNVSEDDRINATIDQIEQITSNTNANANNRLILVNESQKGNPILKFMNEKKWEYKSIQADYQIHSHLCILYLTLKVYRLKPNYIIEREKMVSRNIANRILICNVDVDDCEVLVEELCTLCMKLQLTLILAWSNQEVARYIETFRNLDGKALDNIKPKHYPTDQGGKTPKEETLTSIKSINKTDAVTLISTFSTLSEIFKASKDDLSKCPGLGPVKVNNLYNTIHQPFKPKKTSPTSPTSQPALTPTATVTTNNDVQSQDK